MRRPEASPASRPADRRYGLNSYQIFVPSAVLLCRTGFGTGFARPSFCVEKSLSDLSCPTDADHERRRTSGRIVLQSNDATALRLLGRRSQRPGDVGVPVPPPALPGLRRCVPLPPGSAAHGRQQLPGGDTSGASPEAAGVHNPTLPVEAASARPRRRPPVARQDGSGGFWTPGALADTVPPYNESHVSASCCMALVARVLSGDWNGPHRSWRGRRLPGQSQESRLSQTVEQASRSRQFPIHGPNHPGPRPAKFSHRVTTVHRSECCRE